MDTTGMYSGLVARLVKGPLPLTLSGWLRLTFRSWFLPHRTPQVLVSLNRSGNILILQLTLPSIIDTAPPRAFPSGLGRSFRIMCALTALSRGITYFRCATSGTILLSYYCSRWGAWRGCRGVGKGLAITRARG